MESALARREKVLSARKKAIEEMQMKEAEQHSTKAYVIFTSFRNFLGSWNEEKKWRIEVQDLIIRVSRNKRSSLREKLDYKENIEDNRKYFRNLLKVFEVKIFRDYFLLSTFNGIALIYLAFIERSKAFKLASIWGVILYNLAMFTGPIESFYFHYNAMRDRPYSHLIRTQYIKRFPNTKRAKIYERIEKRLQLEKEISISY